MRIIMQKYSLAAIITCLLVTPVLTAKVSADELRIPVGQQARNKSHLPRPIQGDTTDKVLKQFGEPTRWNGPVGNPPISSWIYPEYIVYFENDIVLHVVLLGNEKLIQ